MLGRGAPIGGAVLGDQLTATGQDFITPTHRGHQLLRNALDLPDGSATARLHHRGELHPEVAGHQFGELRVVGLRGRHRSAVQYPTIDGAVDPVGTLDAVEHRAVGVQVRVPGTVVEVDELRHRRALTVHLLDSVGTGAGEHGVVLDPRQRLLHGFTVGTHDRLAGALVTDAPQH